ncbi:MAG: HPF/RaiA family ribosome-associated protein [Betaproteobacteria bacterium]|nr:HPF/RaiA family ribosome-associated protein [Betaproteobacteria bacterium]MBI2292219.1 HPF/RaiA family ribosome-associated protein [Betaproteobacteria bacterium]
MQSALQITRDDMPHSAAFDARIREKVAKLERICPRLAACRVAVTAPYPNQQNRRLFTVRLNIMFPGGEVVVTRDHHEDINVLLRDAFVTVRRELDRCSLRNGVVSGHLDQCGCRGIAAQPEPAKCMNAG